ncbi:MAG: GIY-YIG nuclease family protein [Kiritimatiellae bacterium]|nr:GIY-YIG nuclease family protein [Kiritimatiellia bacterium]
MIDPPEKLRAKLRDLPSKPGCYVFRDENGQIVYVGKAINLKRRVNSYFDPGRMSRESPKRRGMVKSFADLEWIEVRNEAEALLTEGRLIKDYRPRFNTALRDDKRYLALKAERHLPLPRFSEKRIVRDDGDEYFGPFPSSTVVRTVRDFAERRWGLRKCEAANPDPETHRHCHDDRIAACSAPCIGKISAEEYRARFDEACAFVRRGNPVVFSELAAEMRAAAAAQDYEKAAQVRDTIEALREMSRKTYRELAAVPSGGPAKAVPDAPSSAPCCA